VPSRAALPPQAPVAAASRSQLLLVQRLDGSLTIGDTHEYDEPFGFDVDETAYATCSPGPPPCSAGRCRASSGAGPASNSEVVGTPALYHRSDVAPGVVLVTGPAGAA